ncbi:DUF983 domain-containing protein [Hymenobacter sp. 5317J-9]|uniref:DUF983 domain-containing protein n=1 Tax=Hymenobacter sp. 5317J-9 TaxID=2932250 RepID=UPI001FD634C3|nr:DUF983 domain-containing protein [Hymenobacter sp. 5317J-9]UOQ99348.1 DUF983 domain-containing protein [Hymenobacter sp. 5317J-9]
MSSSAPAMTEPTDSYELIDSTALALAKLRCPRCHQGKLFSTSALNVTQFAQMPVQCPVCGQSFEPEPGFYFGSMYITFAFNVGTFLVLGVLIYYLLGNPDTWVYVAIITGFTVLFTPLILRYSRALMLYLFGGVQYDRKWGRR